MLIAHSGGPGMDARGWHEFGRIDEFVTIVAMSEDLVKHISDARLEIFEDSGHYALVEEPEKFYRVIKEFVETN